MHNFTNKSIYTAEVFGYRMKDTTGLSEGLRQTENELPDKTKSLNQLLDFLPLDEYESLLAECEKVTFSNGENVRQYGDRLSHVYFPLTTVFSLIQILEDGKTCEVALIGKEGCLRLSDTDEASFVTSQWVEVAAAGEALKIKAEVFNCRFGDGSVLRARVNEYINSYIEQLSQKVICNCFHSIKQKFCDRLLAMQKKSSKDVFSSTHESMARALGVQRPSISVIAKQLEREKIISYSRGKIKILESKQLEESACGCHAPFSTFL